MKINLVVILSDDSVKRRFFRNDDRNIVWMFQKG